MAISNLTPVEPWPSRKLPQERFDASVKTAMDQMSVMVGELNDSFIPAANETSAAINTLNSDLPAIRDAPNQAAAAAASAEAAARSAGAAAESVSAAAQEVEKAKGEVVNAQAEVERAKAEADRAKAEADRVESIAGVGPATAEKLGLVKPQTGADDGFELGGDGTLRVRQATDTQRGSVLVSETSKAGTVPIAGAGGGLDKSWVPLMFLNSRLVITESNAAWTPPVTGWARVTVIGGGGGGGCGGNTEGYNNFGKGGKQGGTSSFDALQAIGGSGGGGGGAGRSDSHGGSGGGGGGAGSVVTDFVFLREGSAVEIIIGAGGVAGTELTSSASDDGRDGEGPTGGGGSYADEGGGGAAGASNGGVFYQDGNYFYPGPGGAGGINGTGYGGGGGGGRGRSGVRYGSPGSAGDGGGYGNSTYYTYGGNGGSGAVIIEYYDPEKEAV